MSHLSSVDVLHYKAQPILSLERVLQRLKQQNIYIYILFFLTQQNLADCFKHIYLFIF